MPKKAKEKFDWVNWHRLIHGNSEIIDPQYADIIPATRDIIYTFRLRQVQERNLLMPNPTKEKIMDMTRDVIMGFASSLSILCPSLEIRVGTGTEDNMTNNFEMAAHPCVYPGEISTRYKAKTGRETKRIQKYLATVPTDNLDSPKDTNTFFCYD